MLTVRFCKCYTSIFNIIYWSWAFHSAYFYLIRAWNKKWDTLCYFYTLQQVHIFLGKTQNDIKTHCLSHNIQFKTIIFKVFEKSEIWDDHFFFIWDRICFFNGLYKLGQKNAHKTETFLLLAKIVRKLIITGISIIYSIITQWETILWWIEGIFL